MKNRQMLTLLSLGLLLTACPSATITNPPPTLEGLVSGLVKTKDDVLLFSLTNSSPTPLWTAPHRAGQVLILSKDSEFSAQSLASKVSSLGLPAFRSQSVAPDLTVAFTPAGQSDLEFASTLEAKGFTVQPNYIYQSLGNSTPNDLDFAKQSYLQDIAVPQAWNLLEESKYNPSSVKVAVLDTGFDFSHPDLANRVIKSEAQDFCSKPNLDPKADFCDGLPQDSNVADETFASDGGHGTSSAGLIGAQGNNSVGITGVTWSGVNILPLKVFGGVPGNYGADTIAVRGAIKYATSKGVKVINMSLGLPIYIKYPNNTNFDNVDNPDPALRIELEKAASQNILVVASAGNSYGQGIYYPASDPSVLAVGATDNTGKLWSSIIPVGNGNFQGSARPVGTQKPIDLVAPGVEIYSLNQMAKNGYGLWTGTSESAPMVSGIAALLYADKPSATRAEIVKALKDGANSSVPGYDAKNYGAGRVDAYNALLKLRSGTPVIGCDAPGKKYPAALEAFKNNVLVKVIDLIDFCSGDSKKPYKITLPYGNYMLKVTISDPNGPPLTGTLNIGLSTPALNAGDIVVSN
jgi:subtilisin family serine protease